MKLNPIVKRELTAGSRSPRLAVLVMGTNAVLFAVGLLGLFGRLEAGRLEENFNYRGTLLTYGIVLAVLFVIVLFLFPAMTTGSISSETAGGTMDLMLAGGMSPQRIIAGKFTARLLPALTLLFSFLPALLLPLIYGGVGFAGCLLVLLLFVPLVMLLLAIGLFAGAAGKNGGASAVIAYGTVLGITVLPVLIPLLTGALSEKGQNRAARFMVLSPVLPVLSKYLDQIGRSELLNRLFEQANYTADPEFLSSLIPAGIGIQLLASVCFLFLAVFSVSPGFYAGKGKRAETRTAGGKKLAKS